MSKEFMSNNNKEMKTPKYNDFSQLPLVLTPMDIREILGISKNNAYALCNSAGFPSIKVGKRILINRDKFLQWFDTVEVVDICA